MAKLSEYNNLGARNSKLAEEWHPTKNGDLRPKDVTPKSDKKIWWLCNAGHEWEASIKGRQKGNGCPYCFGYLPTAEYNLASIFAEIAKRWHPTKNGTLEPSNVLPKSCRKIWWLCEKNHEWKAAISSMTKNSSGCPYCNSKLATSENNLFSLFPLVAKEWHPIKNGVLRVMDIMPHSNKKFWWICEKNHEWEAVVSNRIKGVGCPYCAGYFPTIEHNLAFMFPNIVTQWHPTKNGVLKPSGVMPKSIKKVWWICPNGHEWMASIANRTKGSGCPFCSKRISKVCVAWLDELEIIERERYVRVRDRNYCVDGIDLDTNTVYEFLGNYWHGNPERFNGADINHSVGIPFGELFFKTLKKFENLHLCGFKVIYRWENSSENIEFNGILKY